ncbi:MAG: tetratricopeptide repeat protein, partial [Synechococcales bacterium]|nr:tetratricopeptide repeat protein [Synechococcales bacterium]
MKNRHWLDFAEYVSLVGIGAGTVMSVLSKQFLYASTPLSFAMLVGFANRRRIESAQEQKQITAQAELKQNLTKDIELLNQHLQTLPSPEMIGDVRKSILRHNREEMKRLAVQVNSMQEEVVKHLKVLEGQNLGSVRDDIRNLENSYSELYSGLANLRAHLNQLANSSRVDEVEKAIAQVANESKQIQTTLQTVSDQTKPSLAYLQEQVNYLSRQMKALPPPVDASSIKRELAELVSVVAELVPKRDLNSVVSDVRALQQQQDSHTQADTLLKRQIQDIQQRLQAVPDVPQFRAQIEEMLERELRAINQQLRTLPSSNQFQAQMRVTLQQELDTLNQQLQTQPHRPYELIFDLHSDAPTRGAIAGSRQVLEEALDTVQQRLILVYPWSKGSEFDRSLTAKLEALLKRNCQLDVGWCHLTPPQSDRYLSVINRRWAINPLGQQALQATLKLLLNLKRQYPQQFRFKVLGTVENFLVADNQMAVLGIENRLKVATLFDDLELKLRTTDGAVIRQLTQRFDHPALADDNLEAFWNRAVTQYDLGDRTSSLTDLDRIIAANPMDAAAYNMRGVIHYDRQDPAGAIADFSRAIEIDPNRGDAFCNRGFIHSELGDQYGAIADFSLALEANPTSVIAYFYRGLACQKLHDHDGAIADYSQALQYSPDSAVVLYHRGMAYQTVQNFEGAIEDLEQAASQFRDAGNSTNVRRAMQQLALAMEKAAEAEMAAFSEAEVDADEAASPATVPDIVPDTLPDTVPDTLPDTVPDAAFAASSAPLDEVSEEASPAASAVTPTPTEAFSTEGVDMVDV